MVELRGTSSMQFLLHERRSHLELDARNGYDTCSPKCTLKPQIAALPVRTAMVYKGPFVFFGTLCCEQNRTDGEPCLRGSQA